MTKNKALQSCINYMTGTNPYAIPLEQMKYSVYSINSLLEKNAKELCNDKSIKDDNVLIHRIITRTLEEYLRHYPAPFSFKQRIREKFLEWITKIEKIYGIYDEDLNMEFFEDYKSKNVAITIIKELHNRDGVTKKELSTKLGITPRAVLNAMDKLDGDGEPYYLGDQPVRVEIEYLRVDEDTAKEESVSNNARKYRTYNTLNPIILQENMLQLYTLIKCMLIQIDDDNKQTLLYAVLQDVYFQLSEYARQRVHKLMEVNDKQLLHYLQELDELAPTDDVVKFITEREMKLRGELSGSEEDDYYAKREFIRKKHRNKI